MTEIHIDQIRQIYLKLASVTHESERILHMTREIANQFQALVYRLEAQIARTETRLVELKAQLEAARKLATDPKLTAK